jgi:hypothetical protein
MQAEFYSRCPTRGRLREGLLNEAAAPITLLLNWNPGAKG